LEGIITYTNHTNGFINIQKLFQILNDLVLELDPVLMNGIEEILL